jgi:hypothetical protein
VEKVICEVFFNDLALVAATNNKIIDPMGGVDFHEMPKDWFATDLDHRLRLEMGFLRNSGAQAPG